MSTLTHSQVCQTQMRTATMWPLLRSTHPRQNPPQTGRRHPASCPRPFALWDHMHHWHWVGTVQWVGVGGGMLVAMVVSAQRRRPQRVIPVRCRHLHCRHVATQYVPSLLGGSTLTATTTATMREVMPSRRGHRSRRATTCPGRVVHPIPAHPAVHVTLVDLQAPHPPRSALACPRSPSPAPTPLTPLTPSRPPSAPCLWVAAAV